VPELLMDAGCRITDGLSTCACDHRAVVLSCSHQARRWAALECRSALLVVDTQGKGVFQRNPQS